ncbi:hypothetical protein AGIG_G3187 [Arapaima gigas]
MEIKKAFINQPNPTSINDALARVPTPGDQQRDERSDVQETSRCARIRPAHDVQTLVLSAGKSVGTAVNQHKPVFPPPPRHKPTCSALKGPFHGFHTCLSLDVYDNKPRRVVDQKALPGSP